jgi:hypothetical protein
MEAIGLLEQPQGFAPHPAGNVAGSHKRYVAAIAAESSATERLV